MFRNSNGRHALAVTLAIGLSIVACGPSTATPIATASLGPGRSPIPTLGEGMTRFKGTITDANTGYPVEGVCVIIGPPVDCQENFPHSDDGGFWLVDLPVGGGSLSWTFNFSKPGYALTMRTATSFAPGELRMDVQLPPK